jgi:hypothetical protein
MTPKIQIYVDADACPVKAEAVRVADRHGLTLFMVSNSWMRLEENPLIQTPQTIGLPSESGPSTLSSPQTSCSLHDV